MLIVLTELDGVLQIYGQKEWKASCMISQMKDAWTSRKLCSSRPAVLASEHINTTIYIQLHTANNAGRLYTAPLFGSKFYHLVLLNYNFYNQL